jgi:cell division protein YceG involved in septum cleavage
METAKKPVHKKRPWQRIVFAGIVLFASVLMFQETYYRAALSQEELRSSNLFPFIIEKGELPKSVAKRLQKEGFLDSSWVFLRYAKRSGEAEGFQAGKFYLHKNTSYQNLSKALTKAAIEEISVTLREGLTNAEIDAELARLELIKRGEFWNVSDRVIFRIFRFFHKIQNTEKDSFFQRHTLLFPKDFLPKTLHDDF